MENWKKGCFIYLAALLTVIGLPFLFMIIVDPYNLSMLVTAKHINGIVPDLPNQSRLAKAASIIHHKPDTIIVGSSVVDGGFAISGSTYHYDINRFEHRDDYAKQPFIFNAGIRYGVIEDGYDMMKHAYANNPHLKHVIAGYEWGQFTKIRPTDHMHDAELFGHTSVFPIGYKKYFTWIAFNDALHTIESNNHISRDDVIDALKNPLFFLRSLFANDVHAFDEYAFSTIKVDNISEYIITAEHDQSIVHNIYFAYWFAESLLKQKQLSGENAVDEDETLEVLRKMVAFAKEKNITFTLYISPHPPIVWSMIERTGLWPSYKRWLERVAEITPFYDYSRLPQVIGDDAHKEFGYDTLHFLPQLGHEILPDLLKDTETTHSAYYVTKETLDHDLTERRKELTDWLRIHSYQSAALDTLNYSYISDDLPALIPTAYKPVYKGFQIIRHFANQYIAVPATKEPYDFNRIMMHGYHPMFTGKSLKDVVGQIDRYKK